MFYPLQLSRTHAKSFTPTIIKWKKARKYISSPAISKLIKVDSKYSLEINLRYFVSRTSIVPAFFDIHLEYFLK